MNKDVSVIFNGYKRPHTLRLQYEALKSQTIVPKDYLYWQNTMPGIQYDYETAPKLVSALSNVNFGVWSRFYYALNVRTPWVCIFDDDTIPGNKWIENCLDTFENYPGLLTTIGVVVNHADYGFERRVGWDSQNESVEQVDFGGHAWFFHRDMLSTFCRELPPIDHVFSVGEDIHFSWMLQKYTQYKTWVPPHPKSDKEMWGSLKGWEHGGDAVATAGNGGIPHMAKYLRYAYDNGFKFILGDAVRS
jgi:hypothetical protein